jgi:hypothetical protein
MMLYIRLMPAFISTFVQPFHKTCPFFVGMTQPLLCVLDCEKFQRGC